MSLGKMSIVPKANSQQLRGALPQSAHSAKGLNMNSRRLLATTLVSILTACLLGIFFFRFVPEDVVGEIGDGEKGGAGASWLPRTK